MGPRKCEIRSRSGSNRPKSGKRNPRMNVVWNSLELGLATIGVLLIVLGALVGTHWEEQIDKKFQEEMVLTATSEGSAEWIHPSLPIITKIYFWNWTNVNDIGTPGYKPVLDEIGPYTFTEQHFKVNLTWNENGTVSYRQQKYWYFEPQLSSGNLTDIITTVNIPVASLSAMTLNANYYLRRLFSLALVSEKQRISWSKTVGELLFDGFDNPIIEFSRRFDSDIKDKFGFFYGMNGTISADVYSMDTGARDIFQIGRVESVNNGNSTMAHEGSCSEYRGSFGEFWSPHLTNESVLTIFMPDMCRYNKYYYEHEATYNGIPSLVYASTALTVDNGSRVEENTCFCDPEGCKPSGLFDLRSCRKRAPVFMSLPHLHLADPVYHDAIIGMKPDHEKHRFYLELEPKSGIPLNVAARLQLNVQLVKNAGITMFRKVEDVLMPIWWMETVVSLPESHTSRVNLLLWVLLLGPFIAGFFIVIGLGLILFLLLRRYCGNVWCRRKRKEMHNIEGEKSSIALIGRIDPPSQSTTDAAEFTDNCVAKSLSKKMIAT